MATTAKKPINTRRGAILPACDSVYRYRASYNIVASLILSGAVPNDPFIYRWS